MRFKIQILNMCPASVQVKILKRMTGNQLPNEIKKEPEDDAQSVIQDDTKVENVVKPWKTRKGL